MIIVDSHCHLFYKELEENLDEKVKKAKEAEVEYILTVSTDYSNIEKNIEIARKYDNMFASVGIHPDHSLEAFEDISSFLNDPKVVAVGEVGLDYRNEEMSSKESQKKLLEKMLNLALDNDLPCIIHARDCYPAILDIISSYQDLKGVFHCYTGTIENARKILDMGFYISFSGIITFKNAVELRKVLKYVPLNRLLVETDAPYLAPYPYRGETNEPIYVRQVAEKAAEIKEIDLVELAEVTTSNFLKLFIKNRTINK